MSEIRSYRRKYTQDGHLITQSNLKFINELKKYCCINEIRYYMDYFKLLPKYRKLKGYTFKTSINTEEKTIEVWGFNTENQLEFKDFCQLSTTTYLLSYDTTYFKDKAFKHVVVNPSNDGLITQYENGIIDDNGNKILKVRILRDKTAQQTNDKCVYVIKDIDKGRRYYHIEKDISNTLLSSCTPPLPNANWFDLKLPPKPDKTVRKNSKVVENYINSVKAENNKKSKIKYNNDDKIIEI